MKKKIVAMFIAFAITCGVTAPKAHADEFSNILAWGGGAFIGFGASCWLCEIPDESIGTGMGIGFCVAGLGLIIWGICDAVSKGDPIFVGKAEKEENSVLQHVKFGSTGKDFSLSTRFKY